MDILGVMILGTTTAVGGGIMRDVIIGRNVPVVFENPSFLIVAGITTLLVFITFVILKRLDLTQNRIYKIVLNITDSLDISKPHLILPFSKYLQVFAKYIFNRENEGVITKSVSLSEELPNSNEKYLIEQFRNNENDEIHIKNKKSDNSKIVKTKKTINNIKLSDKEFVNLCKKDKHKKITSTVKDNGNFDITIEETEKLR